MIARHFGLPCSLRCETVLALGLLLRPDSLVPTAHRLANDGELSAVRLASGLRDLPPEEAQILSRATLERAGISLGSGRTAAMKKFLRILNFNRNEKTPESAESKKES
jgi:hypothetical protein